MSWRDPTSSDRRCNICHKIAATHPRCAQCGIFVGPGHADTALVDGKHCFTCRRLLKRWEAAEAGLLEAQRAAQKSRYQMMRWQEGIR